MNINDYIQIIINSVGDDWHMTHCWGHGSGPSYKNHFQFNNVYNGTPNVLLHESHSNRATYKADISISMAWGLSGEFYDVRDRIVEDWAIRFPNNEGATVSFIDFFYNDSFVFRKLYATVDGARCRLPLPDRDNNGNFTASTEYSELMRLLNSIEGEVDYDYYLRRSGITLNNNSLLDD